jgi:hypothetical protein
MPAEISESVESRSFTVSRSTVRERIYHISGTDDEEEVENALWDTAPAVYRGLALDSINADPLGGGYWKGFARYARAESDDEYTFDTGGGSVKITQSLSTVAAYAPAGLTAPDFQGAIGVSEDRVEGVEVNSRSFQWTETHRFTDAFVGGGYKLTLFNLTGRINDASFKGLAAGECLFLGASGSKRGTDAWSITFRFAASPNVTGLAVGDITDIEKLGWDYMWVRYADYVDSGAFLLVKRPVSVHVERVYETGDFSALAIGV